MFYGYIIPTDPFLFFLVTNILILVQFFFMKVSGNRSTLKKRMSKIMNICIVPVPVKKILLRAGIKTTVRRGKEGNRYKVKIMIKQKFHQKLLSSRNK